MPEPKRHKASAKGASPQLTQELPRTPSSDEERNTPTASGQVAAPVPDHDTAGWRGVVEDVPRALCAPMARDVALVLVDRPRALAIASAHVDPAWQPSFGCPCARARARARWLGM